MLKKFLFAVVSCLALSPAFAALTFTLTETGGNVVLTASGSVNTSDLTPLGDAGCIEGGVQPDLGILAVCSDLHALLIRYEGLTGPSGFGPGGETYSTHRSGDPVALWGELGLIYLPLGYVSGAPISGTATFVGATLASLGVTPGTYTWTFGSGASADSAVLIAGAVVNNVPTLGEWALVLLMGLMAWMSVRALGRRTA